MEYMKYYEHYPGSLVAFNLLFSLTGFAVSLIVLAQLGTWAWVGYLALYLLEVAAVLAFACTRCCYYGKACGTGYGKLAALFFKKGNEEEFHKAASHKVAGILMFVTSPLPILGGIASLIVGFSVYRLLLFLVLIGLTVAGFVTRPRLVCGHCKQAESGRCMMAPRRKE
jgi:hypothetical protein